MKAFSSIVLTCTFMALNSYGYFIVDDNILSQPPTNDTKAKLFKIDDDGMGPVMPKEIEQSRFPASIPTEDENGQIQDSDKNYKRLHK
ncbi:hypothetical protein [Bacteriovorax sp. BAL6_X]|uniref:hypothetical protein n=1 Tax=Bacteriovorax sp. BAL6_X TaxID=1201290 RepID=UPI0004142B23|nr:hypothetical protein [Bacteriovorax sp. BAL6_X]